MKVRLLAAAAGIAAVTSFGAAHALTVIDFEATPSGPQAEGFSATGDPQVSFFSALGTGLDVETLTGGQSDGQSLLVNNDFDGNYLKGVFNDGTHNFLSMTFGNDDPAYTIPGDQALLTVYLGSTVVGMTAVVMNRNDMMDQTIGFTFGTFDSFTFAYTNAAGSPFTGPNPNVGLIEVVDNITFDQGSGTVGPTGPGVPEAATWALMIVGFGGVGAMVRARRRAMFA